MGQVCGGCGHQRGARRDTVPAASRVKSEGGRTSYLTMQSHGALQALVPEGSRTTTLAFGG